MPIETAVKVIDASALVALVFEEPEADMMARRIEGFRLIAPELIRFELANVCLKRIKRQPLQRDNLLRAFRGAANLAIETQPVNYGGVLELAETTGLTAYDASCLRLARELSAELETLDGQLAKAAAALAP